MKDFKKSPYFSVSVFAVLLVVLGYLYLYPGSQLLLEGSREKVLSDGTDPTTTPFQYTIINNVASENPHHLLYGAVPSRQLNAPYGSAVWMPWIKRWSSIIFSPFVPTEQMSTAFVWFLLVLNGLSMFLLGRVLGWAPWLSGSMGIAWAFSAFTRARAKVHMGLAGIYHLPLIFLALTLIQRSNKKSATALASILFLISAWAAYYHMVLTLFLSPFFLVYFYLSSDVRKAWKTASMRLAVAVVPAVLFLGWTFMKPVPSGFLHEGVPARPESGITQKGDYHPFLKRFASHPIDYIAGDTAIGLTDWNPLRKSITKFIHKSVGHSNPHERANSIRWVLLAFFILAMSWLAKKDRRAILREKQVDQYLIFFAVFTLFGLWASLPPEFGLSYLIHSTISQFRVPSRSGIVAHFGVIMVAGIFINSWAYELVRQKKRGGKKEVLSKRRLRKSRLIQSLPVLFPVLMVIDLPPVVNKMPTAPIVPAVADSAGGYIRDCGMGIPFPYVSGAHEILTYYQLLQSLRNTDCEVMVGEPNQALTQKLLRTIPLHPQVMTAINNNDPRIPSLLRTMTQCMGLNWIQFQRPVPQQYRQKLCRTLGWKMISDNFCKGDSATNMNAKDPLTCLK